MLKLIHFTVINVWKLVYLRECFNRFFLEINSKSSRLENSIRYILTSTSIY